MPAQLVLPLMLKSRDFPVLVVGAGPVGRDKIDQLLAAGCRVRVVAREAVPEVRSWAATGRMTLRLGDFRPDDLGDAKLVVAATSNNLLNQEIRNAAHAVGAWVNVVDVPELCDVFFAATLRRDDLTLAISTGGGAPALASVARSVLEQRIPEGWGLWTRLLVEARDRLAQLPQRKRVLRALAEDGNFRELCERGDHPMAREWLEQALAFTFCASSPRASEKGYIVPPSPTSDIPILESSPPMTNPGTLTFRFVRPDDETAPLYAAMRDLRWRVLRRPLGMPPGSEVGKYEATGRFVVGQDTEGTVRACAMLVPTADSPTVMRIAQVAVDAVDQRKGWGRAMILWLEAQAAAEGAREIIIHGRTVAQGFWTGLGYVPEGEVFLEVDIPHLFMRKTLNNSPSEESAPA